MRSAMTPRMPRKGICSVGVCASGGASSAGAGFGSGVTGIGAAPGNGLESSGVAASAVGLRRDSSVRTCEAKSAREMRPSAELACTVRRSTPSRSASCRAAKAAGGGTGVPGPWIPGPGIPGPGIPGPGTARRCTSPVAAGVASPRAGTDGASNTARTSRSVMRPLGPLPAIIAKSTPSSLANRFAAGDARTRSPGARAGAAAGAAATAEPVVEDPDACEGAPGGPAAT